MATGVQLGPAASVGYHNQHTMLELKDPNMEQGYIPVVSHVITDEDIGSLQVILIFM